MITLQHNPYRTFITSATPVGLYARQKWLGREKDRDWQAAFDNSLKSLLEGQLQDGSWGGSFHHTVKRLFGLHLTLRHPSDNIIRALDWLINQTKHTKAKRYLTADDLRGLPFVPGDPHFLYPGITLFLAAIFGLDKTPEIMTRYEKLSQHIIQNSSRLDNHGDRNNILRALIVHPEYSQSDATASIVECLSKIQDSKGIWTGSTPFYQTINALAHLDLPLADKQLEKAFMLLSRTQNPDGTWGITDQEWNTFLIVHAMRNKKIL
jgi:hypothetical protein